ncbi:DUF934 domain-containing protein [Mangrovicella endophytica]|uniref:DUF934 domain-containing protein n=1 Tax=Mangrovicella endophytica TaxID=2066697 RepID=UPI000C9E82AB|nr:DUF934 domain-containing protein [Mangrovicella endophytica]
MTLITRTGEKPEDYRRVDAVEDLRLDERAVLVPLAFASAALAARPAASVALSVPNDTPVEALQPYLAAAPLIAVEFPSFSDGRGLSLAKRLRRAGFAGTLRASGPLIADQFAEALACGFDEVELPETMANRQPVQQWMEAKDIVTSHYQSGYGEDRSILQKRLAARKG